MIGKRDSTFPGNIQTHRTYRYKYEFWILCLLVSIGAYEPIKIGFYNFRLIDLVLILSFYYCIQYISHRAINYRLRILLISYFIFVFSMVFIESFFTNRETSFRTIFGMAITYLTPCIFFVIRETQVKRKILIRLLIIACFVSLASQLGLLSMFESNVGGVVNIGKILGIPSRRLQEWNYDYTETTITIWRALFVGLTIALLLLRTKPLLKFLGLITFILQFAGAGGTRSSLLFLGIVPIIFAVWYGNVNTRQKLKRVGLFLIISVGLGSLYLWGPFGDKVAKKDSSSKTTHVERVSEVFVLITEGRGSSSRMLETNNARMYVWDRYINIITSSPSYFIFGSGLNLVGFQNIKDVHNKVINKGLAHNVLLDVWGNTGLIGLLFFLVIVMLVLKDLKQLFNISSLNPSFRIIGISYSIAVLYFFQYLLFQAVIFDRSFMIVFYLTAGTIKPITSLIVRDYNCKKTT